MNKFFLIILSLFTVSGCHALTHPVPLGLKTTMPGAPEYTKGWEDGCFSGMAAMSNSYYQTFYHFKQDVNMTTNQLYYQAWKDSFTYCRQYVLKWTHDTIDAADSTDPNR